MNEERWELYHLLVGLGLKNRNGWINILSRRMKFTEEEIKEIEKFEDNEIDENKRLERMGISDEYYCRQFNEWKKEDESKDFMKEIYRDKIRELKENYKKICDNDYKNDKNYMIPYSIRKFIRLISGEGRVEKQIKDYAMRLRVLEYCIEGQINPDMIVRAREYPIESIVESKRGYIVCPFHEDSNPSMWIKNNFGYCFSCGTYADSIELFMKVHGVGFVEAVKKMQ
ncbi:MAG: CHC2 zinc finger domain-containing protein [Smithella sp.]|jgi:hypothetical protein